MSLATRRTPERNNPLFSGLVIEQRNTTSFAVTSGTTPVALTTAQVLTGLLTVDCQDTGSITLPTAAALVAAIPGIKVGDSFDLEVINFGDSVLTLVVNTGITAKVIAGVAALLTMATLVSKRFRLVCTGVLANGSASDAFDVYGFGSVAAAVA